MTGIKATLHGSNSRGKRFDCEAHKKSGFPGGLVVYTERFRDVTTEFAPLINAENGANMNVDGSAGGTPEVIHNGIDTVAWTGSNVVGSKVTFNSTARPQAGSNSVLVNNPALNDIWQFDKGSNLTASSYVAISLGVNIDKDWAADSVNLYAWDTGAGAIVGVAVLLEDYIDETNFDTWQTATIPFSDLGLASVDFDAIRMGLVAKDGGKAPVFYIDTMQAEETGPGVEYSTDTESGYVYYINELIFTFAGPLAATLASGTMPALSYNKILGLSALASGMVLSRTVDGVRTFSIPFKQLSDFVAVGFVITNQASDGTNTIITLKQTFKDPLTLLGGLANRLSVTIQDNLSSLLVCRVAARGVITKTRERRDPGDTSPAAS